MTRQQVLFTLGVMGLKPYGQEVAGGMFARSTYEALIETAIKRGLERKARRQLIGAARRGVATPFVMSLIDAVCDRLSPEEIDFELISLSRLMGVPFSTFKRGGAA